VRKTKEYCAHTSVSLKRKHIEILNNAAIENKVSANDLMILLLRFVNKRSLNLPNKRARIQYQESDQEMRIVNLYLGQRDYERNIDSRRFGKVSVSWLLAYAIDNFLDAVIKKIVESISSGIKVLNNYLQPQVVSIKKKVNRIKLISIWYPIKE